jgi:hypothetical protein
MSQLVITTALMESQRERARRAAAAVPHLAPLAVIAAILAATLVTRLVAIAISNREVMEALREALVRTASALSMPV